MKKLVYVALAILTLGIVVVLCVRNTKKYKDYKDDVLKSPEGQGRNKALLVIKDVLRDTVAGVTHLSR
jgi:hypothetical protein